MGAYTLLQDLTVATNSTTVVLNNFGTITKDDFVKIAITSVNASGSRIGISLLANSSITSNYHRQFLVGSGASIFVGRVNTSEFSTPIGNGASYAIAYIKLSENDRLNIFSNDFDSTTFSTFTPSNAFNYCTSSGATFSSGITSLTLSAPTNSIATGTRIQIYKLDAEKVADITVASNTTQVDISNLSINKDSEYLLVSEFIQNSGNLLIGVNDNTTINNYFHQTIGGSGSTAFAVRRNEPRIADSAANARNLSYNHIKLSNIGAFTTQNYSINNMGTSNVNLQNSFVSSTAENISSITKINLFNLTTNGIGAGSRFTLYKLYE